MTKTDALARVKDAKDRFPFHLKERDIPVVQTALAFMKAYIEGMGKKKEYPFWAKCTVNFNGDEEAKIKGEPEAATVVADALRNYYQSPHENILTEWMERE